MSEYPASGRSRRDSRDSDDFAKIESLLGRFADIRLPKDAPQPILAPTAKAALYEWMIELGMGADLQAVAVKPRKSALLYGNPGTGKTSWAHYFAARLGLPLACVRSESLITSFLGQTGQNIGQLFDAMAKTEGKVVILFDEVDVLGGKRMQDQGASVERANSLNVLLRRIENFNGIALAATNREKFLDDAFWRRFDMQIPIDLPGADERFAIIRLYADPFDLNDDDTDLLTELTVGASPALIRALIEGMKRSVITWQRVRRTESTAVDVFSTVIAAVNPAPEYQNKPPLWENPAAVERLSAMEWPLRRKGQRPTAKP